MKSSLQFVFLLAAGCGLTNSAVEPFNNPRPLTAPTSEPSDAANSSFCGLWSKAGGECGDSLGGVVTCYRGQVLIHSCYCMTYDKSGRGPFVGKCFFSGSSPERLAEGTSSLIAIPCTASRENLTYTFCNHWSRDGLLCGDCKNGYAPRVYSFDMACMPCNPNDLYVNLIKFVSAALLPTTAFLLLILLLRIKITNGTLNWFIFFSQVVSFPFVVRSVLAFTQTSKLPRVFHTYAKLCFSFYGIWNLDFVRPFMPGICFSSLNTRQAIALDGVIAVYPLIFLVVLYILIYLYDRNYKIIVFLWRPFRVCFTRCRQIWDIQNSVVDTFAAFVTLSYSKTLNFVFDVGFPAKIYEPSGEQFAETVYYNDASISLSDKKHLPYLVLTGILFLGFNILPVLLLCFYPTRCGRSILRRAVSSGTLQIFSDTFQGYYKDGTDGTRDLRFFPAVYLLARIFLITIYSLLLTSYAFFMIPVFLVGVAMTVVLLQPYKPQFSRYNRIDAASILLLAMLILTANSMLTEPEIEGFGYYSIVSAVSVVVMSLLPPLYVAFLLVQWITQRIKSAPGTYQALINQSE